MRIPQRLMPHGGRVSYEALEGQNSLSEKIYGQERAPRRAFLEDKTQLVKNATGEEKSSTAHIVFDLEHDIPEGSRITVWRGLPRERDTEVVAVARHDFPGLPQHVEIWVK